MNTPLYIEKKENSVSKFDRQNRVQFLASWYGQFDKHGVPPWTSVFCTLKACLRGCVVIQLADTIFDLVK